MSFPMSMRGPCPNCPRIAAGIPDPCPGQERDMYCIGVEQGVETAINTVLAFRHLASAPGTATYRSGPPTEAPVVRTVQAPAPSPEVARFLTLIARMKACPSWVASSSCGCGTNKCLAGKGRQGFVSHQDCFGCLREADALIATPHPSTEASGS